MNVGMFEFITNVLIFSQIAFGAFILYRYYKRKVMDYFVAIAIGSVVAEVVKYFVNKPRPVDLFEGSAFPSAHTTVAFTSAFFFLIVCHSLSEKKGSAFIKALLRRDRLVIPAIYTISMLVSASVIGFLRIYIGAHDIYDVFAGIILSAIICLPFTLYDVSVRRDK